MNYDLDDALVLLERTPRSLDILLRDLPEAWIRGQEGEGTWSPFDVLGHLIHGEETDWIPRLKIILEHGQGRSFEPFDRFAQNERSKGKSMGELLDRFAELRTGNLESLRALNLQPTDLEGKGRHPELGEVTGRQLLATWVVHDLGHIAQITRVMAKQYAGEVGPWRRYLGVLQPPVSS